MGRVSKDGQARRVCRHPSRRVPKERLRASVTRYGTLLRARTGYRRQLGGAPGAGAAP
jgi:hypothetical protein